MTSKRLYFLLLGVIGLLFVGLLAGAYGTNNYLVKKANTLTGLKAQSQALDRQQDDLVKAKKDVATYSDLEKITESVVPQEKNQAAAVREIVNIASAKDIGITLTNITFPASTLGAAAAGTSATSKPVAVNPKTAALSQLVPVVGIPGVYQLVINVENNSTHAVTYQQFVNFLDRLEHDRHTAQVSNISLQPDSANSTKLTFSLSIVEYVKP